MLHFGLAIRFWVPVGHLANVAAEKPKVRELFFLKSKFFVSFRIELTSFASFHHQDNSPFTGLQVLAVRPFALSRFLAKIPSVSVNLLKIMQERNELPLSIHLFKTSVTKAFEPYRSGNISKDGLNDA